MTIYNISYHWLLTFYFEMITDSQKVAEACKKSHVPFTQFLPMEKYSITITQFQNQDMDISTSYRIYSDFTSFTCTYLCVCIILCFFSTCVNSCKHYHINRQNCSFATGLPYTTPSPFLT